METYKNNMSSSSQNLKKTDKYSLDNFPIKTFTEEKYYRHISDEKMTNRFILLIPYGIKSFLWFTKQNGECMCLVIEMMKKKIHRMYRIQCYFDYSFCEGSGTILSGTIFMNYTLKMKMYTIENVYFFKGKNVQTQSFYNRLLFIKKTLKGNIKSQTISIGVANITFYEGTGLEEFLKNVCYKTHYIQCHINNDIINTDYKKDFKEICEDCVFWIKRIQYEIYHLYDIKDKSFQGIACIPNYNTSKLMEGLFVNIKQNLTLDSLEESDDEEEDIPEEKEIKMKCVYHEKFKMWVPIEPI